MNYQQAIDYIESAARGGSKPGLERVAALLEAMGSPHRGQKYVHVAGTNGKGSTCAMVESILRTAGYKVGLYISPYLEDYRERMQINRELIPRDTLAAYITQAAQYIEPTATPGTQKLASEKGVCDPRKFEIETAVALQYFADQQCDISVLEVGLGGRLDATNVIGPPEVAAITPISCDHTQILGDTPERIAHEKCGVIKRGSQAVSCAAQHPDAIPVIERRCAEQGVPLSIPDEHALFVEAIGLSGSHFLYKGEIYAVSLIGAHQIQNALTAIEVAGALRRRGFEIPPTAVKEGLLTARWNGRLEIVQPAGRRAEQTGPLYIIDGAHNADAVSALCGVIDSLLHPRRLITVMAMGEDKRADLCAPMLARRSAHFIATEFRDMHPIPAAALASFAMPSGDIHRPLSVEAVPDVSKAVERAKHLARPDDVILACGSLYMIGDAKRAMSH